MKIVDDTNKQQYDGLAILLREKLKHFLGSDVDYLALARSIMLSQKFNPEFWYKTDTTLVVSDTHKLFTATSAITNGHKTIEIKISIKE